MLHNAMQLKEGKPEFLNRLFTIHITQTLSRNMPWRHIALVLLHIAEQKKQKNPVRLGHSTIILHDKQMENWNEKKKFVLCNEDEAELILLHFFKVGGITGYRFFKGFKLKLQRMRHPECRL